MPDTNFYTLPSWVNEKYLIDALNDEARRLVYAGEFKEIQLYTNNFPKIVNPMIEFSQDDERVEEFEKVFNALCIPFTLVLSESSDFPHEQSATIYDFPMRNARSEYKGDKEAVTLSFDQIKSIVSGDAPALSIQEVSDAMVRIRDRDDMQQLLETRPDIADIDPVSAVYELLSHDYIEFHAPGESDDKSPLAYTIMKNALEAIRVGDEETKEHFSNSVILGTYIEHFDRFHDDHKALFRDVLDTIYKEAEESMSAMAPG